MTVWIRDLVGLWVTRDAAASSQNLGYPTVACGFGLTSEEASETEAPEGYSIAEIEAIAAAVLWLGQAYPDHWRALSRDCRPWTRRTLPARPGDDTLVELAWEMLAQHVNQCLR